MSLFFVIVALINLAASSHFLRQKDYPWSLFSFGIFLAFLAETVTS